MRKRQHAKCLIIFFLSQNRVKLKGQIIPAFQRLDACLQMATDMVPELVIAEHITSDERYRYLFTVEAVNQLVRQGVPFRDAYRQIGRETESGQFHFPESGPLPDTASALQHTHAGSMGHLCNEQIEEKLHRAIRFINLSDRPS